MRGINNNSRMLSTPLPQILEMPLSIEYGSAVWDCNKNQASALEAIILGGAKKILGCSSKTCNEAVRGDMGLDSLSSRRDRAKLKWWKNLCTIKGDPRQLFDQVWEIEVDRGRCGVKVNIRYVYLDRVAKCRLRSAVHDRLT